MDNATKKLTLIFVSVILLLCLFCGILLGRMSGKLRLLKEENESLRAQSFSNDKLIEVRTLLDKVFIGEIDEDFMTERLCGAMVEGIDDEWSYYISADEYAAYTENITNSYVGVGITIRLIEESDPGFTVVEVSPDSPAERAGVMPGDYLVAVEGESAMELGMDETKNRVRGESGTEITVTFRADGVDRDVTMKRESVKSINITYEMLDDGIGYIHIRNFETDCAKDTIAAIEDLQKQGVKGIVFDLRFNPGGLKNELVKLLDYLLPEGVVFHSESITGEEEFDRSDAKYLDLPMSVLVNVDSYSAAELFAASMQEYDAATIVGTQTYGKGYFQQCFRLSDGSAINVSTGKYYTPEGVSLAGVGITPDRVIEVSDEEYYDIYLGDMEHENDVQLQEAINAVKGK